MSKDLAYRLLEAGNRIRWNARHGVVLLVFPDGYQIEWDAFEDTLTHEKHASDVSDVR